VNFLDALNAARKKATKRAHFRKLTTAEAWRILEEALRPRWTREGGKVAGRKPKKTKHISFTTASGEVVDFRVSGKRKRARAAKRRDRANFQGLDLSNLVLTL
jgi:hypothetical protein